MDNFTPPGFQTRSVKRFKSMLVKVFGSAVYGVDAVTISIEVNVLDGLHTFVVGLADSAIKESIRRVESAIKSNGFRMPRTKVIISLAPADLRKSGSAFDLPIALGILAASGQLNNSHSLVEKMIIMAELTLNGDINPLRGALAMAQSAKRDGFTGIILPLQNAAEATVIPGLEVLGMRNLREVVSYFDNPEKFPSLPPQPQFESIMNGDSVVDFADVRGQENIKRALEIAAAGGHHVIMTGPPGSGKTMLASSLPGILPELSDEESLETTRIYSVAGQLLPGAGLIRRRPLRMPHHTISNIALVGGGAVPQPGEISLAHNGILFLDEFPEFRREVLEVLRQPIEQKNITISRAGITVNFPSNFMLIAAMNPCPCGYSGHPTKICTCSPGMIHKYRNRVSGPLLDRIDLHIEASPVTYEELNSTNTGESSSLVRHRVQRAREIQHLRYASKHGIYTNGQLSPALTKTLCMPDKAGGELLKKAVTRFDLSVRAHDRILKVARTIADLEGNSEIKAEYIAEAIQYRTPNPFL